jgi:murein DD-endopeptidase MepM/ murein hydrolase activator NlpD
MASARVWGTLVFAPVIGAQLVVATAASPVPAQVEAPNLSLQARSFRAGELVVVTVAAPPDAATVAVRAFGRDIPAQRVGPGTWRALVGLDLDVTSGTHDVSASIDGRTIVEPMQIVPRTFPVRRLKVNPDFVNPPPALAARIEEESRLVERAYAQGAATPLWEGAFRRPVPHPANSRFGTRSVFNGEARSPHGGTDFLSPAGTPVHAPNAGRVLIARDLYFAGQSVMIDHGGGLFSQLAHLSRVDVQEGGTVRAGQVVGLVGATGRVTGAHLHWAVRVSGARVDAMSLLAMLGDPSTSTP